MTRKVFACPLPQCIRQTAIESEQRGPKSSGLLNDKRDDIELTIVRQLTFAPRIYATTIERNPPVVTMLLAHACSCCIHARMYWR